MHRCKDSVGQTRPVEPNTQHTLIKIASELIDSEAIYEVPKAGLEVAQRAKR